MVEENQDSVCKALDMSVYEALVKVLILEDVQVQSHIVCVYYGMIAIAKTYPVFRNSLKDFTDNLHMTNDISLSLIVISIIT